MDLRYQSAALPTNARITRLPGEAAAWGQTMDEPGCLPLAGHPPDADFLVRSLARPNEVLHAGWGRADAHVETQFGLLAGRY